MESKPLQRAYQEIRAYFSQPDAVLGKTDPELDEDGPSCVYLGTNGQRCAVGCRLSDAWIASHGGADTVNSCGSIEGLHQTFSDVAEIIGEPESRLWEFHKKAQFLHDSRAQNAKNFVKLLDEMAVNNFGLTVPGQ